MKRLVALVGLIIVSATVVKTQGLNPVLPRYQANTGKVSLVATAQKVTVQQPGGYSNPVHFEAADIYCSVACVVTFYQNGTAATATTLAVKRVGSSPNGTAVAFSSSDVGTGNTLRSYDIPAGGTASFDITQFTLPGRASGASNFSVGIAAITGDARIQIQWTE